MKNRAAEPVGTPARTPAPRAFMRESLSYLAASASEVAGGRFEAMLRQRFGGGQGRRGGTLVHFRALAVLRDLGECRVSRLAELCLCQQPTMSKALDWLEARSFVRRVEDRRDRRRVPVRLTPAGEREADQLVAMALAAEAEVMAARPALADPALRAALLAAVAPEGAAS